MDNESNKRKNGGFMAIYHDIEEIFYGPDLGLTPLCRVLLCLRHKLLRDGLCQKAVGRKFIMDSTGLTENQVNRSLKTLETRKIVLVRRIKEGNRCLSNQYELNPEKFGKEYNWYKNNPTVRVYNGSQTRSYSTKGPLPKTEGVPLPKTEGGVLPPTGGVIELSISELLDIALSKNPSKEPISKEPFPEIGESFTLSRGRKQNPIQCSDPQEEAQRQINLARATGVL
jgi:hypothetical protein